MQKSFLWCINSPCINCIYTIHDAFRFPKKECRWQNHLRTFLLPDGWTWRYNIQSVYEDYNRCINGCRNGIFSYYRTTVGRIHCQLCSTTPKTHAKCLIIRRMRCVIAILWVKVLIFQGTNPLFNVGSLSLNINYEKYSERYRLDGICKKRLCTFLITV